MGIKFFFSSNIQVVVLIDVFKFTYKTVADPGFSWGEGGGCGTPKRGVLTYYFANFFRKLHENEKFGTPRGRGRGRTSLAPLWIRQIKTIVYEMVHFISDTEKLNSCRAKKNKNEMLKLYL